MDLLLTSIVGLLLFLGMPCADTQNVVLTSNPSGRIFCNGSEVIFTCETRGSATLEWSGDDYYVGNNAIAFIAELDAIDSVISTKPYTTATLIRNNGDGVLESTLRTVVSSNAPSGNVICTHSDAGTRQNIDFQVLAPPMVPQDVVTFQLEHVQDMCAIASVLQTPTNSAEAGVTSYTVSMDGENVPSTLNADSTSTDGTRHSTLLYNSSCGAHRISIATNNLCGQSPGTDEKLLDPEQRFMLNVTLPEVANITIKGSSQVYYRNALIGVAIAMALLTIGAFILGFLCGYLCKKYQLCDTLPPKDNSEIDLDKKQ